MIQAVALKYMPGRPCHILSCAGAKHRVATELRRGGCISECLGVRFVTISACAAAAAQQLYTLVNVYECM